MDRPIHHRSCWMAQDAGATSVTAYFPAGEQWYSLALNSSAVGGVSISPAVDTVSGSTYKDLYTPLTATNIHVSSNCLVSE